jgi:hypothetical protein
LAKANKKKKINPVTVRWLADGAIEPVNNQTIIRHLPFTFNLTLLK